jgi:hypothetical protein
MWKIVGINYKISAFAGVTEECVCVRYEVLTAMTTKFSVPWGMMLSSGDLVSLQNDSASVPEDLASHSNRNL